jgi:ribosomal subunit interface protein
VPIQISAHGFELTEALKEACIAETEERLKPIARHNFSCRWTLNLENLQHSAHIAWNDGQFHGDATVKSEDMYTSIHHSAKKSAEQIKKAHEKKYETYKEPKLKAAAGE